MNDNIDTDHKKEFHFTLNKKTPLISSISYPGVIHNNEHEIITSLGGNELVKNLGLPLNYSRQVGGTGQSIQSDIFLRLNPNDRFSKFIPSTKHKRSDILIKVKRSTNTKEICEVELVGIVIEKIVFDLMADFYYSPPDIPRNINFKVEDELNESSTEPLFIPPSIFSRILLPFHYRYDEVMSSSIKDSKLLSRSSKFTLNLEDEDISHEKTVYKIRDREFNDSSYTGPDTHMADVFFMEEAENSLVRTESKKMITELTRNNSGDNVNIVCRYSDEILPLEPLKTTLSLNIELLNEYEKLFTKRPIWLRSTLDYYTQIFVSKWKKKYALARTSFLFSDGPWRGTLCKFGYDPRMDNKSRFYQTIDFRDSFFRTVSWKTKKNSSDSENFKNKVSLEEIQFQIAPKRPSQLYQLIDIEDVSVKNLLSNAKLLSNCCKESGWFLKQDLTKIRNLMLISAKRMRNEIN